MRILLSKNQQFLQRDLARRLWLVEKVCALLPTLDRHMEFFVLPYWSYPSFADSLSGTKGWTNLRNWMLYN